MSTISPSSLLDQLNWRYATKQFDPAKKIPADVWAALEKALILSASSYGLQPYRFVLVETPSVRAALRQHSWGQAQVTDASHYVVFARKLTITEEDVAKFIQMTAASRGMPAAALDGYRDMMVGDLVKGPRSKWLPEWAGRQAYIALGNLLTSAALVGVDACPMEGLDPVQYDKILDLAPLGYATVCSAALGYRSASDKYAGYTKVRYPADELFIKR